MTLLDLSRLIEQSHGAAEAQAFRAFDPSDADKQALADTSKELLTIFPPMAAACVMMSALLACRLQATTHSPVYVAAGALLVGRTRVFGEDGPLDGRRFSQSNPSWDGHAWVAFGGYIADPSLFRTAYSRQSHPALAAHVLQQFGPRRGMMIARADDMASYGLTYIPQYTLTQDQIAELAYGAMSMIPRS